MRSGSLDPWQPRRLSAISTGGVSEPENPMSDPANRVYYAEEAINLLLLLAGASKATQAKRHRQGS